VSEREKGGGRGELFLLVWYLRVRALVFWFFYEKVSRVGWPAKEVVSSARRTVRRRLDRRMSMLVNKIQFDLVV
jgi:hypothetical protein